MKFLNLLLVAGLFPIAGLAQITTVEVRPPSDRPTAKYDSLRNFVGEEAWLYKGQTLYVKGQAKDLRKFGYSGFVYDYKINEFEHSNIYCPCNDLNSAYDSLVGKYFKVLEVIAHPKAHDGISVDELLYNKTFFLKLEDQRSKNIIYYKYDGNFGTTFPFLVTGYFLKAKSMFTGKYFTLRGRNWEDGSPQMQDIKGGGPVNYSAGTIWKCVDFSVEERYFEPSLILQNSLGQQLAYPIRDVEVRYYAFSVGDASAFERRFGKEIWGKILQGQLQIGMTNNMCRLAIGSPIKINPLITKNHSSEQWVYNDRYLNFLDGKLTSIQ